MHRKILIDWFYTPKGRLLKKQELTFLKQAITVSCKQVIVQVGALGWEDEYIDCTAYEQFYVLDNEQEAWYKTKLIKSLSDALPFKHESVDMVILPHVLEFSNNKHEILREVKRILKPEGKLLILGFNPWNPYINFQYIKYREKGAPWVPHLLTRTRISDWLNLLNFEVKVAAGFKFDRPVDSLVGAKKRKDDLMIAAYAVKATKRCYNLIPLTPVKNYRKELAMAKMIEPVSKIEHNENS